MGRDAGRCENLGGQVVMGGPKIFFGEVASSKGRAKNWGGGALPSASDIPECVKAVTGSLVTIFQHLIQSV